MTLFTFNVIKVMGLAAVSSVIALLWSPLLTNFLYKRKLWKKTARQKAISGEDAIVFNSLHKEKEIGTPRMGGLLIWVTAVFVIFLFFILSLIFPNTWLAQFNFLSRSQTWLPLFTLAVAGMIGLLDDILVVSSLGKYIGGGISFKKRLLMVAILGFIGSIWFYQKLGWDLVYVPFLGDISFGIWYIPFFIIVMVACWSGGIIDGLDGLSGGTFASIFGAFTIIAFSQGKIDLAAFCAVILGTLFAFLWFNIPPARFYMGETGVLGLTALLCVIAFLTNSVYILPIIGGLLAIEVLSVIIQLLSKKIRKKKLFLSTPIHHHLEAIGWPPYKVTMRFWIIGIVLAIVGAAIRLLR
ncbi:MAG: phospho-N-acetylmuramoyl-pentapeptide-transferase [Patescibacteria group bacterium]